MNSLCNIYSKSLSIYDWNHSIKVALLCYSFAKFLKLDISYVRKLLYSGLYHDIGKSNVAEMILNKPDKLTAEEFKEIEKHPSYSYEICKNIDIDNDICEIILHHHERFDSKGYPFGKDSDRIPFGSRIVAICDNFDALSSDRPYRNAYSFNSCIENMIQNSSKFDPELLNQFLNFIHTYDSDNNRLEMFELLKIVY
ncbi:HD-GYP domain-containing protein [Wukongibacter baidiensis]